MLSAVECLVVGGNVCGAIGTFILFIMVPKKCPQKFAVKNAMFGYIKCVF